MKTLTFISALFLLINVGKSQSVYEQKMQEALQTYSTAQSIDDYKNAAANFDRIANVESQKWEPLYYHAQSYIMMSFIDQEAQPEQKDSYLAFAEKDIQKMIEIAPKESEVYALQAMYYTAKLVINPMERGQKYGALTQSAIQQSLALDANNPRAKYLSITNKIGTAQFFGSDISSYCTDGNDLLAVWDDYSLKGPFYPVWGKDQLIGQLKTCSATETKETTELVSTKNNESKAGNTLTIKIKNLDTNSGMVLLELLDKDQKTIRQAAGAVQDLESTVVIDNLPAGEYGIQYFHDANKNQQMDKNKHGAPLEKYGFSNNKRGFMKAPKYKKTLFTVDKNTNLELKAK